MAHRDAAVFRWYGGAHRDCAQYVPQAVETEDDEETKTNAQQRVEQRLHTDPIDDEDEQCEAENEGERLQPDKRPARGVSGGGFRFFREFFCIRGWPVFG